MLSTMGLGGLVCLRGLLAAAAPAPSRPPVSAKLVQVRATGSKHFAESDIIRATGLRTGDDVTVESLQEISNRLAALGVLAEVRFAFRPVPGGLAVEFKVQDASRLLPCHFANFVWWPEQELLDNVRSRLPLFYGETGPGGNMPDEVSKVLQDLLVSRNIRGQVTYNLEADRGGPVRGVLFQVEGVSLPVRGVELQNATHVSPSDLRLALQPLIGTSYDQFFLVLFLKKNVGPLYQKQGFLRVAFGKVTVRLAGQVESTSAPVQVTVPINEGLQYRLGDVTWTGNTIFSAAELDKRIHVASGQPVNAIQLQEDLEGVHDLYGTRGYLVARVQPSPMFDDPTQMVKYVLEVHEGDLYRMGNLEIAGVDLARAATMRRSCRLSSGDPFDTSYWKSFLSENSRNLPRDPRGWRVSFQQSINQAERIVNVTITYQLGSGG